MELSRDSKGPEESKQRNSNEGDNSLQSSKVPPIFCPTMIHFLIQNAPLLRHAPSPRATAATREIHVVNPVRIAVHPVVIDVVLGMLVRPERVLPVDAVEANVGSVAGAEGELSYVAPAVDGRAVRGVDVVEALVPVDGEVLLSQHGLQDVFVAVERAVGLVLLAR